MHRVLYPACSFRRMKQVKMSVKKAVYTSLCKTMMDTRTLIAILVLAVLWRIVMSFDQKVLLWESICSGIFLFVLGWTLFVYIYCWSARLKGWLELNKIYLWISICTIAVNFYVIVYYAERWYRLAVEPEYVLPLDYAFRSVRFIALILFYCAVVWMSRWLKKVGADYELLFKKAEV